MAIILIKHAASLSIVPPYCSRKQSESLFAIIYHRGVTLHNMYHPFTSRIWLSIHTYGNI